MRSLPKSRSLFLLLGLGAVSQTTVYAAAAEPGETFTECRNCPTMVVLPEGDEILDVLCGDRDFWVISATQNIAACTLAGSSRRMPGTSGCGRSQARSKKERRLI